MGDLAVALVNRIGKLSLPCFGLKLFVFHLSFKNLELMRQRHLFLSLLVDLRQYLLEVDESFT